MPEAKAQLLQGLVSLRIEQAKLLKTEAVGSCAIVQLIVIYITAILLLSGQFENALIWFTAATTMVLVVYLYARFSAPEGITPDNVDRYLMGQIIISALTGLVWSSFSIFILDGSSYLSLFISGSIVCSITAGGMLPNSAYRPSYVALATTCLVPLALYWLLSVAGTSRFISFALLLYYGFGMFISAKAEIRTHDLLSARKAAGLMEELGEKNELIQRAYDEKSRFIAATSHDLSQPLHAQGYFIQALRRDLKTESQHELLDKIENSWKNQSTLLRGIADVTRLDSGIIVPKIRAVDLALELEQLAAEYKAMASEKSIKLHSEFATQAGSIVAETDPVLLTRIIRNLLSNAIKFTDTGGRIDFQCALQDGNAEITIRDTGNGIPMEQQSRVFAEYIQLDNGTGDREKGLGLGLSIVQRLVTLLQIDLRFNSVVDQGTEFKLIIPIALGQKDIDHPPKNRESNSGQFNSSPLIVVVDDENNIREGMSMLMTEWGCQVIAASSSQEATALLNATTEMPALLLVDKRLALGESGFDVINNLREEVNADTPAVMMTGDLKGFEELGADSDIQVMPKPINPDEIKELIQGIIGKG